MHSTILAPSPSPAIIFPSAWSMSSKSSPSPPSTTSSTSYFSLSPSTTPLTFSPSSPGSTSCAYPSWPQRASLSPTPSTSSELGSPYECANSRISDDDLADLAEWVSHKEHGQRYRGSAETGISWSRTVQPPAGAEVVRRESRKLTPQPTERKRRRSSPLKKTGKGRVMSTITE